MKFHDIDDDDSMKINLDPMIDCVFLLIIFFLATTAFVKIEQDLTIDLPKKSREIKVKKPPAKPIVVNVKYQPGSRGKTTYHVDNEQLSLAALTVNLSRARVRNKDQAVVIRGDRRVKWEHVAAVMSCSADAGITKVSATVEIDEQG